MDATSVQWACDRRIPLCKLNDPTPVFALDGSELPGIHYVTVPETLTISGNHQKTISFSIFHSTISPVVFVLVQHNPQINWVQGTIQSWNLLCHVQGPQNPSYLRVVWWGA